MVPTASGYWPVNADVVHPIEKKLLVPLWMKFNSLCMFSDSILSMSLAHIPFLEENDFNGVFTTLRDWNFLFTFNHIDQFSLSFKVFDCSLTGFKNSLSSKWSCKIGHTSFKVDGLEGGESEFSKHGYVVLITERTYHQDTTAKVRLHRRVGLNFNAGLSAIDRHGELDSLTDEVSVSLVLGMHDHDATSTNQFWASGRNHDGCTVFTRPFNINKFCSTG